MDLGRRPVEQNRIASHQRVLPTGMVRGDAQRQFPMLPLRATAQNVVNPLADVGKYLPNSVSSSNYGQFDDPKEVEMYNGNCAKLNDQAEGHLLEFNKYVLDEQDSCDYLRGGSGSCRTSLCQSWKIGPSHYGQSGFGDDLLDQYAREEEAMGSGLGLLPAGVAAVLGLAAPPVAEETPKRGGTLTY